MAQIQKIIQENQKLKYQLEKFKGSNGLLPYVDDSCFKGGYRVVKTITDRDKIDCCHRKQGMKVIVVGEDLSFKEYILKTDNCKENTWEEINVTVEENEVFLIEDYSELSEDLITQKDLNLVLKQLILNLQTQIDNIELIDEKVQITENTNFAQIGQTQKDFNKNVSDFKTSSDLKNQEQDDRMSNIEGENVAQNDLINGLQADLDNQTVINVNQDERLENLEGINYTWSPTNRTLTLYDNNGTQLSQVSLVSLDNEGTDIRYNASTLSLELYNADNELLDSIPVSSFIGSVGTQLQLNSNQLQLKDSQGNILSTVSFVISNIQGLQTALDGKLDKGIYTGTAQDLKNSIDGKLNKPTTTSTTASYPYVVGEDGNGNSARLPAGDLGKNFFNSDLNNTTARTHTMNAGVTVNTLGNPYTLAGLPNRNTDTAFNKILVANATGQQAIVDNSYNILKSTITPMTDAQKLEIANLLGASTGSAGIPSVNLISPPIIQNQYNSVEYILLRGANLYLNSYSMSIQILASDKITVVATIPNNQIQLYADGTQLIFYYNFYQFPQGQYFIKLTSGIKTYITTLDLNIVQSIVNKDLTNLNWNKLYAASVTPDSADSAFGQHTFMKIPAVLDDTTIKRSFLSDEIFAQGDDFYLEINVNINIINNSLNSATSTRGALGLCYSNNNNNLNPISLIKFDFGRYAIIGVEAYNNGIQVYRNTPPITRTIVIIKTGNLFRMVVDNTNYSTVLSNNNGYKLILQAPHFNGDLTINTQIIKAFTF